MNRSFNNRKFFGVMALGTLAGAAVGAILSLNKRESKLEHISNDIKNMTRNLEKKAKRQAKNLQKEDWIEKEKDKIMSHVK